MSRLSHISRAFACIEGLSYNVLPVPDTSAIVGRTISHYNVLEKLGGGGMGVVYKAKDTRLGRNVALKFLPDDISQDPQAIERFRREARAASALNHPNICTIHDIGEFEGRPFIAMELLEGQTLKHRIAGKPIEISESLGDRHPDREWARCGALEGNRPPRHQACEYFSGGARAGQDSGFWFGEADASDAALPQSRRTPHPCARRTHVLNEEQLTSPGSSMGTVAYMSPEQARGEELDARSDLFSLGVVLYEMATGSVPFSGATSAVIFDGILHSAPPLCKGTQPAFAAGDGKHSRQDARKGPGPALPDGGGTPRGLEALEPRHRIEPAARCSEECLRAPATHAAAVKQKSVAVLYFENQSGAKEDEYFRDGITEDIVTEISKIAQLEIFPRSEMLAFRDKPVTAQQVGQQLGRRIRARRLDPPRRQSRADHRAACRSLDKAFCLGRALRPATGRRVCHPGGNRAEHRSGAAHHADAAGRKNHRAQAHGKSAGI